MPVISDLNYLEETSGGPYLTVATVPKSGKIVLLQVRKSFYHLLCLYSSLYTVTYIPNFIQWSIIIIIIHVKG